MPSATDLVFNELGLVPLSSDKENLNLLKTSAKSHEDQLSDGIKDCKSIVPHQTDSEIPENHPIIYMKPLDVSVCTPFPSKHGKKIFKDAIKGNYMNIYFVLAPHLQTQLDTNLCAAASLAMTLNALGVDPGRMWKYPWRWYDETMLNTCIPTEKMQTKGVSFDSFTCLIRMNKLNVEATRVSRNSSLEDFRNDIKQSCSSEDTVIILNYSRPRLNQTGTGHFSPVGGYDQDTDSVLILDTARFKFPPYWVPLVTLWEALGEISYSRTGYTEYMPRGYFTVSKTDANPTLTLKLPGDYRLHMVSSSPEVKLLKSFFQLWDTWLENAAHGETNHILQTSIHQLAEFSEQIQDLSGTVIGQNEEARELISSLPFLSDGVVRETTLVGTIEKLLANLPTHKLCNIYYLIVQLSNLFHKVTNNDKQRRIISKESIVDVQAYDVSILARIITSFLIFWPYRASDEDTIRLHLQKLVENDLKKFSDSDILTLDQQIRFISNVLEHFGHEELYCQEELYFD